MKTPVWVDATYLFAAVCFIVALKLMNTPATARRGNWIAVVGMAFALGATLFHPQIVDYRWLLLGLAFGTVVGAVSARKVKMTAMPQMVALFNGVGGGAVALVALIEFARGTEPGGSWSLLQAITAVLSAVIGSVSFSGSLIAFAKLQELMTGRPLTYPLQKPVNLVLLVILLVLGLELILGEGSLPLFLALVGVALLFGVLFVIPVGGADMPVVIALLNSFTGVAAGLAGFMLQNTALLTGGALVGASGFILTLLMCAAMNRSLENVFFGALGTASAGAMSEGTSTARKAIKSYTVEDVAMILANASSVIVVPGYGMAVAQAQHAVKELADKLAKRGTEVKYAIHPVAGRMPGHMNVLLAEAGVPYDQLYDLEEINSAFPETDVALVIGANDVVNPAARYDKTSPLYGMPILDVDKARTCVVCKRSLNPGYAGVENELFLLPNTIMLFGDAKATLSKLIVALDNY